MRVLLVDDDQLIRDSLAILLELDEGIQVVGTAANGQEAHLFCRHTVPDLILMDIRMPVMDGVAATKHIKAEFPHIKIVLLTTFKEEAYIKEALENGAEGYILKSQSSDSIIESLWMVYKGNVVMEKEIAAALKSMLKNPKRKTEALAGFNSRELEIMQAVAKGLSNREIAQMLFLSEGTVRNYVTALLEKLDLRDRTQLAIFYIRELE